MSSEVDDAHFAVAEFLQRLDRIFATDAGPDVARAHIESGVTRAQALGDRPALLTLHNEAAGFYRSIGAHDEALAAGRAALGLIDALELEGSEAEATTLINMATAQRAAGHTADARETYRSALAVGQRVFGPSDRRVAALHNNVSLALADDGELAAAVVEQEKALAVLQEAADDPHRDLDIAITRTNLAHACEAAGDAEAALTHADVALEIFEAADAEDDPRFAAVIAARASMALRQGDAESAVRDLQRARDMVHRTYGEDSEAYRVTAANLTEATAIRDALGANGSGPRATSQPPTQRSPASSAPPRGTSTSPLSPPEAERAAAATPHTSHGTAPVSASAVHTPGLELARRYWEAHGKPMLEERYPSHVGRIAAGLVGHGSECYGFDDALSADHDFGVGFCLWLTAEDYMLIGSDLQADYESLPQEFLGYRVRPALAAHGQQRSGVFEIGDFFESITGLREAPHADEPHLWLTLEESTLAAATNGEVFADPHGAFGAARSGFQRMPRDVWLAHISRRAGMVSQAGQYNVPRMLERDDPQAAWMSVSEFVSAASSLVYLLNRPAQVGYLPYYKWRAAALRELTRRPLARLGGIVDDLGAIMELSGGLAHDPESRAALVERVDAVCATFAEELRTQGLSGSDSTFLEHHREEIQLRINDAWLRQQ
ncbi:DUF4037 domain-containing protein [Demequina sediminicola]|uniref:DUF4037 domain-containing protein n=1 Tax=Demequina sediminicola TaxID=1095026 RepID=UPI0007834A0B|nr:DUF4037 domain-containing protein [Demequina sediminicola]